MTYDFMGLEENNFLSSHKIGRERVYVELRFLQSQTKLGYEK